MNTMVESVLVGAALGFQRARGMDQHVQVAAVPVPASGRVIQGQSARWM